MEQDFKYFHWRVWILAKSSFNSISTPSQPQLNSTSTQTTELGTTQLKLVLDYLWLFRTISECLRLSWAISAYLGLTADYLKLSLTILGYLGLSQTILDYLELSWAISDYMGLSGTIWDYLAQPGTISDYLGLSRTISKYLGLSRINSDYIWLTIWDYLGLYQTISDFLTLLCK